MVYAYADLDRMKFRIYLLTFDVLLLHDEVDECCSQLKRCDNFDPLSS